MSQNDPKHHQLSQLGQLDLNLQKAELRRALLSRREGVTAAALQQQSLKVCKALATWVCQRPITSICLYAAYRGEIDVFPLVKLLPQHQFALPVTVGKSMSFYEWREGETLRQGRFGILEPGDTAGRAPVVIGAQTAVLVPCLAVDYSGARLGYGGGFFDRFLTAYSPLAVGIVADDFLLPSLPVETHDRRLDWVVTQAGVQALPLVST
jgi:5-formyltetrahydrofolate cyclo-ligase